MTIDDMGREIPPPASDPMAAVTAALNAAATALGSCALDAQDTGDDATFSRAMAFRGALCALRDRWTAGDPPVRRAPAKPAPAAASTEPRRRGRPRKVVSAATPTAEVV